MGGAGQYLVQIIAMAGHVLDEEADRFLDLVQLRSCVALALSSVSAIALWPFMSDSLAHHDRGPAGLGEQFVLLAEDLPGCPETSRSFSVRLSGTLMVRQ